MGGLGTALSGAASAIGSGVKSLYGDEKNYLQTGSPTEPGHDPTMTQALLYGQQPQQQETPAQRQRRMMTMQQG
jgi:hypothetical protein